MNWTESEMKADAPWDPKYGHKTFNNSFREHQKEWERRKWMIGLRQMITQEIECIFEPRQITPPETSEFIEALVTMTDARQILEVGMYSGFTTLHVLRAIVGKAGAKITSIDCRKGLFNEPFFTETGVAPYFEFVHGESPAAFNPLTGPYDIVFIDSDHSPEHTKAELEALERITKPGTILIFHDLPKWPRPDDQNEPLVRKWILGCEEAGWLHGLILPTCEQLDCKTMWGAGYPPECNPHLGIFRRSQ